MFFFGLGSERFRVRWGRKAPPHLTLLFLVWFFGGVAFQTPHKGHSPVVVQPRPRLWHGMTLPMRGLPACLSVIGLFAILFTCISQGMLQFCNFLWGHLASMLGVDFSFSLVFLRCSCFIVLTRWLPSLRHHNNIDTSSAS